MRLYVSAVIDYEITKRQYGDTVRVPNDEAGRALDAKLKDIARKHAQEACREMARVIQQDSKQISLFKEKGIEVPL